jgi:hypothetical protein
VHAGLANYHSHHHQEALGLIAAGRKLGVDLRIYASSRVLPEIQAETGAVPTFRGMVDSVGSRDPVYGPLANFIVLGERFAEDCAALTAHAVGRDDLILMPFVLVRHLYGLSRWLWTLPAGHRPAVACHFLLPAETWVVPPASDRVEGDRSFIRFAIEQLRASIPPRRLLLSASTPKLARIVSKMAEHPCARLPLGIYYPAAEELDRLRAADARPRARVCIPGQFRNEKGKSLAPEIVAAFARRYPGAALSIQVNEATEAAALRAGLSAQGLDPPLDIQVGECARMDYYARLLAADIVLLPYQASQYAARASGVFADAVACGVPVVVPAETWMSRNVGAGFAAGCVFDEFSTASIMAALSAAVERLPELTARARELKDSWHAAENIFEFTRSMVTAARQAQSA